MKIQALIPAILLSVSIPVQATTLDTVSQKYGYAMGTQFGQAFKRKDLGVDPDAFGDAIADVLKGGKMQMTTEEIKQAMATGKVEIEKAKAEKGKAAKVAGEKFLQERA